MKAVCVSRFGGPEVLEVAEAPMPEPLRGEVRVRVHAAGVNPVDTYIRSGNYAAGLPELPYIPGTDGAGVVDCIGGGAPAEAGGQDGAAAMFNAHTPGYSYSYGVGDRVYVVGALSKRITGTYAEYAVCDAQSVFLLPPSLSYEQGAGLGTPGITACQALFRRARLTPGETVLIHGASGGVGSLAAQLAKMHGAVVFGTAGSARGLELLEGLGARRAFDHNKEGYDSQILEATGGRGVDVIIEMLANANLEKDLGMIAPRGRIAIVGSRGSLDFNPRLAMLKDAEILGVMLRNMRQDELIANTHILNAALDVGARVVVSSVYRLAEAPEAHARVMEGGSCGKHIIKIVNVNNL